MTSKASSSGNEPSGRSRWVVLAWLGISDCRSHISDLRFEICHLKSRRACPRPSFSSPSGFKVKVYRCGGRLGPCICKGETYFMTIPLFFPQSEPVGCLRETREDRGHQGPSARSYGQGLH